MFEYVGALHMHSVFSDGSGKADEIAKTTNSVNANRVVVTNDDTDPTEKMSHHTTQWSDTGPAPRKTIRQSDTRHTLLKNVTSSL